MAKSRKKTLSQKVVNTATIGMPKPAKKFLGSRIVALLIVVSIPVLIGTGMVTIQWENGRPKLSINRERTAEVREEVTGQLEEFRENHGDDRRSALVDYAPRLGAQDDRQQGLLANWQSDDPFEERVTEQLGEVKDRLVEDDNQAWNTKPTKDQQTTKDKQAFRPFRDVSQKVKGLLR